MYALWDISYVSIKSTDSKAFRVRGSSWSGTILNRKGAIRDKTYLEEGFSKVFRRSKRLGECFA